MSALWLLLAAQASGPIAAPPLPDPVLAEQRGGFRLPSGIDVALAVQTQTAVDGVVVLRTVFQIDQGTPNLTIYAPKPGETVAAAQSGGVGGTTSMPSVTYTPGAGIQVVPGATGPAVSIALSNPNSAGATLAGLSPVNSGMVTDAGIVTEGAQGGVRTVALHGADLDITHLAGNAFGSAIANMGSDRTIDTQTVVSIDLRNAGPDVLGSAMFRVQDVALDATAMRAN